MKAAEMLEKLPETEVEYFNTIYSLGGFIWRLNHDLADGRIEDPTGGIGRDIANAREVSAELVGEMGDKFGVVAPRDCPQLTTEQEMAGEKLPPAPTGTEYYWDWYKRVKILADAEVDNDPLNRGES